MSEKALTPDAARNTLSPDYQGPLQLAIAQVNAAIRGQYREPGDTVTATLMDIPDPVRQSLLSTFSSWNITEKNQGHTLVLVLKEKARLLTQ
jgi:hypothetical protein